MPASLTIGAVVRALTDEFPDVTVSKVRFLESEGLVTPQRSGSGYRRYAPDDVERLRWVLRAQRDRFWPLKVIKDALADLDRGLQPVGPGEPARVPALGSDPDLPAVPAPTRPIRLTADELVRESGLDADAVSDLLDHGLLRPGPTGLYGEPDLRAARAAAALSAYGLQPRHLRAFRSAADREVGLVEQATASLRGPAADEARAELARYALDLHAALLRSGLGGRDADV